MSFPINGIKEVVNPMLVVMPIILMSISGYGIGSIISSKVHKINTPFFKDLIYGNAIINFVFISGFVFFGVLTYHANEYFSIFTYILIILFLVGTYFIIKKFRVESGSFRAKLSFLNPLHIRDSVTTSGSDVNYNNYGGKNTFVIFGVALFVILIGYHGIIIYYHPIFNEYDSVYLYLPISKSILLGNGLNHNYFSGSDISMRYPPYSQTLNAWLIHSFGYSSLRAFPVYFVFFAALAVYYLAERVTKIQLLRIITSIIFLLTPTILVISSRFSLQEDLPFIFFLSAGFYFLFEIVWQKYKKIPATLIVMLFVSLSLMSLTRQVGLVLSVAIFFLVPAIKFTDNNLKVRGFFTVLSFLPLYVYEIHEMPSIVGIVVLLLANLIMFYIVSRAKSQHKFSSLITPHYLKTLIPLGIPIIFIASNLILFSGLDPGFIFSSRLNQIASLHYQIFGLQNDKDVYSNPINDLQKIFPRIDIFFISVATGSIFIFFKLSGFTRIVYHLKDNAVYSVIIILFIFLLLIWSYTLELGFEGSDIRHLAYFIPILSTVIAGGLAIKKEPSASASYYILYYYCMMVILATYYVLHYNIHTLNYDNHFGGFWIDPFKNPIMPLSDLLIGAALIAPLIIFEIKEHKRPTWFKKYNIKKYSSLTLAALLIVEVYILSSGGILIAPLEKIDKVAPRGWDENVFDVISYLRTAQDGSVMSVRAPAISFFTNRTNFDLYNFEAFATLYSHLLLIEDPLPFKQKVLDLGIRYIVMPNEKTPLYQLVQNLGKQYKLKEIIDTDSDFEKISLRDYDMYKFLAHSSSSISNLIDGNHLWKSTYFARILKDNGTLNVTVNNTSNTNEEKIFNRIYLQTQINLTKNIPLLLSLDYSSQSHNGKDRFYAEISEHNKADTNRLANKKILWASSMNNTAGKFRNETFVIPDTVANKPIELSFYIISDGLGKRSLTLKRAAITYT